MTRNLKALGLALIAVFAMSALAAGSASAAEFHSEVASTKVSASQTNTHVFESTAGNVTCEVATFSGVATAKTTTSLTVTPSYDKCHIIIFGSTVEAKVNTNGCTYTLYAAGSADVNCEGTKTIEVVATGCTVKVGAQKGLKSVSYKNTTVASPTTHHITMTISISGISYSHSGFTCGTGSGTTGKMSGAATASGTDTTGNPTKIWFE